ncbi:hypothetical protein D3C73_1634650 [compost metagenome]
MESSGHVNSTPVTPNQINNGLRPILSESMPYTGCSSMKMNRAQKLMTEVSVLAMPDVSFMNLRMKLVYV